MTIEADDDSWTATIVALPITEVPGEPQLTQRSTAERSARRSRTADSFRTSGCRSVPALSPVARISPSQASVTAVSETVAAIQSSPPAGSGIRTFTPGTVLSTYSCAGRLRSTESAPAHAGLIGRACPFSFSPFIRLLFAILSLSVVCLWAGVDPWPLCLSLYSTRDQEDHQISRVGQSEKASESLHGGIRRPNLW